MIADKELNIINMVKSIQKLKAGMQAIIGRDDKLLNESRDIYLNNTIIYSETDHEKLFKIKTHFGDFLKVDDRNLLIAQSA